ncbi:MAG: GNAT family N-acetyltransferase [Myxococcota bacterium]
MPEPFQYRRFDPAHLDGAVSVARALDWPSYAEPEAALAAFTAPGAVTWVATDEGNVIGLAHLLTNGVVHSHLSLVGVLPDYRRRGIARRLVAAAFEAGGGKWLDLCAEAGSEDFYRSFHHQTLQGFRIHPTR